MDRNKLLKIFNSQISGKNHSKGIRVFNGDLVSSVDIQNKDGLIYIKGNVISENLFNEYKTQIEIDAQDKNVVSTYCSCKDYENNEFSKGNYCCKHLIATFYKAVDDLVKNPLFNNCNPVVENTVGFRSQSDILSVLLGGKEDREEIKIEVYVSRNQWENKLSAEFKIGLGSMNSGSLYVLKDINQFLISIYNNIPVIYGKNFTLNMNENKLSVKDKILVDFIQTLKVVEGSYTYRSKIRKSNIDGKYIHIPDYLVREFFRIVKGHKVYLDEGFLYRCVETEIVEDNPPVEFDLKSINENYVLKVENGIPLPLDSRNTVLFYGSTIYIPDAEYCIRFRAYISVFNNADSVVFPSSEAETVLKKLIPQLNLLSDNVKLSKPIMDKIVDEKCEFKFYFDKKSKNIILTVKVKYATFEFNIFQDCREKIVYREARRELEVVRLLIALGFERRQDEFYFLREDDYIFNFFKSQIQKLQDIGEVFYSENFRGIRSIGNQSLSASIKSGKYDYFEMKFKIGSISPKETSSILKAFRDNLKYYKLKNGEYLDLEQLELKKFLKLLDSVAPKNISDNCIEIPRNKAIYVNECIDQGKMRYISGKSELERIKNRLKNINTLEFEKPKNLQGDFREYQKIGYNWFKTLDYLGFGGILGDEMGLGKTFQTIAFLMSNTGGRSLIVVPTSLVYNWVNEFEKFAPDMRIAAVNGIKKERMKLIDHMSEYDVFITTYNLLKRDMDVYKDIEFDYCILDEAQYIKNSHSENSRSVKKIKSRRRFALTGTPVENSVMELWSIFDFIMPGYLYDEKRFSVRYYKRFKEEPVVIEDLNRLVKPFILRRRKKDVIRELPDKIERTIMVDMGDRQKKVYGTYAGHVLDLVEKKVKDNEFKNSKIEILAYITKLRQLCLDPSIVMENYSGGNAKMEVLLELIEQGVDEGHKILVFSQFTSVLKNICSKINGEGIEYSYLDGSIPSKNRIVMVENFNSGNVPVFLISLKAGGTGLNLTSADIVIHFDPWWNPAVEEQATDRAHRIGQEHVVEVIKLVARGTIEEKIVFLQQDKKKLIDSLLGDELSGSHGISSLSEQEIVGLFR
ncbi:MAG: DEAD/DEAH box helicase [Clostridium sp.]|jgi:SNF2 family DNA or RNA helicase|uniref:DEAD/DEAH box helicase n=1 Tax=Clostridium sp. TaxID=1506 RepID=UPI0025BCC480|nr:DEAD/DEAH box helicase [Clostridium sp.]MCH3963112.1 DEAD/DEAH box helicase [Clostridium sp.]MCI1716425.1 DEAD/DEAH box helicase [Clostridium sp.]MCI1800765.1 DEAD/DEAH box helicase [Clostridium sp.]MCI1814580.1 DEAD/DEAH box helicase [Clostridium sp.]MCI1871490.1 DEAD/DEAH box helicase [Clostridium sp.]